MPDGTALRFVIQDFQPATFLERGAWAPFTSPMLAHARLRIGPDGRREVVIRNPGGGAGWYVGAWNGMIDGARLTVHDRLLYRRIETADAVLPQAVRHIGRSVALEGYAGRAAQDAAHAALAAEAADLGSLRAWLEDALRAELGLAAGAPLVPNLAGALALPAAMAEARLAALAAAFAPVGRADGTGQHGRDLAALDRLLKTLPPEAEAPLSGPVRAGAAQALQLATAARARALAALENLLALLRAWPSGAALPQQLAWLLDGWPALAAAWRAGAEIGPVHARHALVAVAACLPLLPRELAGADGSSSPPPSPGRALSAGQEWLRGATERDIVARHEALLARAL